MGCWTVAMECSAAELEKRSELVGTIEEAGRRRRRACWRVGGDQRAARRSRHGGRGGCDVRARARECGLGAAWAMGSGGGECRDDAVQSGSGGEWEGPMEQGREQALLLRLQSKCQNDGCLPLGALIGRPTQALGAAGDAATNTKRDSPPFVRSCLRWRPMAASIKSRLTMSALLNTARSTRRCSKRSLRRSAAQAACSSFFSRTRLRHERPSRAARTMVVGSSSHQHRTCRVRVDKNVSHESHLAICFAPTPASRPLLHNSMDIFRLAHVMATLCGRHGLHVPVIGCLCTRVAQRGSHPRPLQPQSKPQKTKTCRIVACHAAAIAITGAICTTLTSVAPPASLVSGTRQEGASMRLPETCADMLFCSRCTPHP